MAQAAWVEIQQQQRVRVTAYVPAWALGGCALLLLACGAVATLGAYDQRAALARLLAVAAGVGLCCVATWIAQVESAQVERMRLLDEKCAEVGRDPKTINRSIWPMPHPFESLDNVKQVIASYREAGFNDFVFTWPPDEYEDVMRQFAREVLPELRASS